MTGKAAVLNRIEEMIIKLDGPLPSSELANGWSDEGRQAMLAYFRELHKRILHNQTLTPADFSIARGMDHWGITGGELSDQAADISCMLQEMNQGTKNPLRDGA